MNAEEKNKLKTYIQSHNNEDEIIAKLNGINLEEDLDGGTALNHAVNYDRNKVVEFLVENGANINAIQNECSPLMSACEGDNLDVVKLLLTANADIHTKDGFGNNALWKAIVNENATIVKLLLENGSDPFEESKNGKTFYQRAKDTDRQEMLDVIDKYKK